MRKAERTAVTSSSDHVDPVDQDLEDSTPSTSGGLLGPATWPRALILGLAFAVLGASIGWSVAATNDKHDGMSSVDIGFLRDMFAHHGQAVQMTKVLLYKDDVSKEVKLYAQEILADQSYERGIFNTLLTRAGLSTDEPNGMAMGWMGAPTPVEQMAGMATTAQMKELEDAKGKEAEALFIALMSEHHLGGLHMSDAEVRKGDDKLVRRLAETSLKNQRAEIIELDLYRQRAKLPIPSGFSDPTKDPRLNPLSLHLDTGH